MKKLSKSKNYLFAIGYWLIIFFSPLIIANVIGDTTHKYKIPDTIIKVVVYGSPVLYIIPLLLANLPTIKSKIMFVVWGFVLPIVIMFTLFLYGLSQMDFVL